MNKPASIRLLASTNNDRGDLFTRLNKDLFFALGYDDLRLDVHKSGRELDIQGKHRFEARQVVGECKAHQKKMGGDELNKFLGVLTRERKKLSPTPVAGYFISLAGFTETGIEQERETGDERIILLSAENVIDELQRSHVIVSNAVAAERAGQCAEHAGLRYAALDGSELLGHHTGYIWAIYYSMGKARTHFALIHADGTALAESIANEIVEADRLCKGKLHTLSYLRPQASVEDKEALLNKAVTHYRNWIAEEFGYIQLDGLPADTDLSATRLKLEKLFVPLKAILASDDDKEPEKQKKSQVIPIGELLGGTPHIALLAMPGGGKSTLLKRLSTVYAFPERNEDISDGLPKNDWLPLILRCRELRDRARRPMLELLYDISRHAGMSIDECGVFHDFIHEQLQAGKILLLVDGLDEISDEGDRQTFASHLRTFIAMFPQVALIVTSREAGFRLVASVVASVCQQAKLAPFDEDDVLNLTVRWHVEVVGNSEKVRTEANELGRTIWNNSSIRTLTQNPLLLTTLLVVKRWVGELPRNRAALYREAIKVLVRTWNVEGYSPMDEDETLAQLSYVACAMMEEGKQRIEQKSLLKLLQNARRELEAELQFARISPQDFIKRIEHRSSLLMQTGHEIINGELQAIFEFRHLTFQEYLAARGYVEEQYPGRNDGKSLTEMLEKHFADERWQEVIPLAAVLAGRKAEDLIKKLTLACEVKDADKIEKREAGEDPRANLLYQCLSDEVQAAQPTLKAALLEIAKGMPSEKTERGYEAKPFTKIIHGKFGALFQDVVEQTFLSGEKGFENYVTSMERLAEYKWFSEDPLMITMEVAEKLCSTLSSDNRLEKIYAALVIMLIAYDLWSGKKYQINSCSDEKIIEMQGYYQRFSEGLIKMLNIEDMPSTLAASWAFAWGGESRLFTDSPNQRLLLTLFQIWHKAVYSEQTRFVAWGLYSQELLPRDTFDKCVWGDCDSFLQQVMENERWRFAKGGALVVAWYRRSPWTDTELSELIGQNAENLSDFPKVYELLENLGEEGQRVLKRLKKDEAK